MPCERTGFFAAFAGVCRGRAIFLRLMRQSLWRAIAHLLLTALLCAVIGAALRYLDNRTALRQQTARFEESFGQLAVGPGWLVPTRDPGLPRTLVFPERLKLIYAPDTASVPPFSAEEPEQEPVIVWFPRRAVMMQPADDGMVVTSVFSPDSAIADYRTIPAAERNAFLARLSADPQPLPDPGAGDTVRIDAGSLVFYTLIVGFFCWLLLEELTALALFLLLFLGIFTLAGGTRGRTMTYREILLTGVYVSLPVLPVACCFSIFDLPLLPFSTAYLLGAMGYFLFAVHFIERSRRSGAEVPPTEG